jgi:hypothetical protein
VPAYLKDMFGTRYVGAIHGWLITAWSAAGVFGPVGLITTALDLERSEGNEIADTVGETPLTR